MRTSVLVVNPDLAGRSLLREALAGVPDLELVGTAPTASIALHKVQVLAPDVVIAACNLPDMDGDELADRLSGVCAETGLLLTAPTATACPQVVRQSMEAGVVELVVLGDGAEGPGAVETARRRLLPKVRSASTAALTRLALRLSSGEGPTATPRLITRRCQTATVAAVDVVAVGASTGGPDALAALLSAMPARFPAPIVIVVHLPEAFAEPLAETLNRKSALDVKVAEHGDALAPGAVYLVRGGTHAEVRRRQTRAFELATIDGPLVNGCRPSVDVLFRSVAASAKARVLGVLLTGMGQDGVAGLRSVKAAGGRTLAQDQTTSVVWGMPGRAVEAGLVDEVVALQDLAHRMTSLAGGA